MVRADKFGFTMRVLGGGLSLCPDLLQPTIFERLVRDKFKQQLPERFHSLDDRITLSYPNAANVYE